LALTLAACGGDEATKPPTPPSLTPPGADTGVSDTGDGPIEDADADGYTSDVDCDDGNADINPGALEECDGVDNNCDGATDEGLTRIYYLDTDLDGFGDESSGLEACSRPEDRIGRGGDCDDTNPNIHPEADEYCNGIDDNCDDDIDGDDAVDPLTWFGDSDGDTFGNADLPTEACNAPDGYVANDLDCNDFDALTSPFGLEFCDGEDNDCNGVIDDDTATDAGEWFIDSDGDGWGSADFSTTSCTMPGGFVANDGDCDDSSGVVNPDGTEVCNSIDDNCDGAVDEGFPVETYYRDSDGDTYGDLTDPIVSCTPVAGYASTGGDCDDDEYWSHPGLSELCDEIDNDCDGIIDEELVFTDFVPDADGDGFGDATGPVLTDCIPPAGHVIDATDCDDSNAAVNPSAIESCNGLDDNCSGTIDEGMPEYTFYEDADGDDYGRPDSTVTACILPPGYSDVDTDCDDSDDFTYPGAYEFCDGEDDDCNGLIDDDCGYSRNFVLFVTNAVITSGVTLDTRDDADAYCGEYAADNGIDGSDFRIVYSTPDEDARDYLDYVPGLDMIYDRSGTLIDDADLYDGTSPVLPDMVSWTIVGSGYDGRFMECSGSYESGSWPICQYCDRKFACGNSSASLLDPLSCCWTGNRAIACMGAMSAG
jgi:hypothetical protein